MDWYELVYNLGSPYRRRLDVLRQQLPRPLDYPVRVNQNLVRELPPKAQNILLREIIFELIPYWESAVWLPALQGLGSEGKTILAWSPEINRNDDRGTYVPIADSYFVWGSPPLDSDLEETPRQLRDLYEKPDVWFRLLAYVPVREF